MTTLATRILLDARSDIAADGDAASLYVRKVNIMRGTVGVACFARRHFRRRRVDLCLEGMPGCCTHPRTLPPPCPLSFIMEAPLRKEGCSVWPTSHLHHR